MRWLVVLAALVACRDDHAPVPAPAPPPAKQAKPATADPWNAPATSADDPPSLAERHQLADQICPRVTAPYFFKIEKNGKTSYLLGTRHIGVALAKFPPVVIETVHHAKLIVFEIAPDDKTHAEHPEISMRDAFGPTLWHHYEELAGAGVAQMVEKSTPSRAMLMLIAMYEDPT